MQAQWWIVLPIVGLAAFFSARAFLGQFRHGVDEPEGCAHCPAMRAIGNPPTRKPPVDSDGSEPRTAEGDRS